MEKTKIIKGISAVIIVALTAVAAGAAGSKDLTYRALDRSKPLDRDAIEYITAEAPAAANPDGVISAEEWAAVYPEISATMMSNEENSYHVSYLEESPYLVNIYEGYGFAKDYESARGHNYCLEDVANTARPHAMANCLTCKTPNFTKLVNDQGVGVYTMDFNEVHAAMAESTSCYNCHDNNAGNMGELTVTHSYVRKALGDDLGNIDASVLSCGQCHIEYYFAPDTKETSMPYSSKETMTPEAIYAYYEEMGFSDWTQESTGAHLLKAQHPEMETFLYGKHGAILNCADCHMPVLESENGTVYHSHKWESPLENETLLASCVRCHGDTDMVKFVKRIQEEITGREDEVGWKLSDLKDALAAENAKALAGEDGAMTEEELDEIRELYREAQWYFDFCYVENAEGAHNSELARRCLDTSEGIIEQAMEKLTNL